jgi:hypothetical protein
MKTLGGVGAVVMGAMLLLTVKIGPAESKPAPSSSGKIHPMAAVAAVPEAPPRSTPAAAPVSGRSAPSAPSAPAAMKRRVLVVVPGADAARDDVRKIEMPQTYECSFELELPVRFSSL